MTRNMVACLHVRPTESDLSGHPRSEPCLSPSRPRPCPPSTFGDSRDMVRALAFPGRPAESGPKRRLLLSCWPRDRGRPHPGRAEGLPTLLRTSREGQARHRNGELAAFPWLQPRWFEHTRGKPDWREQVDIGPERPALPFDREAPPWDRLQGPNQWPAAFPEFSRLFLPIRMRPRRLP